MDWMFVKSTLENAVNGMRAVLRITFGTTSVVPGG
jgi:hypothetical protein